MNGDYLNGSLDNKGENDDKELPKTSEESESSQRDQLVVDEIDAEMEEAAPNQPESETPSVTVPTSEIIEDEMMSQEEIPTETPEVPEKKAKLEEPENSQSEPAQVDPQPEAAEDTPTEEATNARCKIFSFLLT